MHLYSFKVNYGHVKLKREEKRKRSRNKAVKVKKIVKKGKRERCKGFNPVSTDCDGVGFLFCVFDEHSSLCCHILCQFLFVVWITNTALLYFGYWYCLSPVSPFQTNKDKTMNCHY